MSKVDLDIVAHVLRSKELVDDRALNGIIHDITKEQELLNAEKTREPTVKKQLVILASDPNNLLRGVEMTGWVLQIPEDDFAGDALGRIHQGAWDFNATPKGRRMPVRSVGEAIEAVPNRIFKQHNVWTKTKEAVWVVITDNTIPTDKGE